MAPPETVPDRRVNILLLIRIAMMVAMMGNPPERASLDRRIAKDAENKLPEPIRFKCFMGKIPVIEPGDGEHAHRVGGHRHADRHRAPAHPEHQH